MADARETKAELETEVERLRRENAELRERVRIASREAQLLALVGDAIFVRDLAHGAITYWNDRAAKLYGWSREEALGRVSHDLLHTEFPEPLDQIEAAVRSQGRWEGELRHRARDGHEVLVLSRWSLQHDDDGRPVAFLEVNTDITKLRRAEADREAAERRFRTIFFRGGVGIVLVGLRGEIVMANPAFARMLGYESTQLEGKLLGAITHPDDLVMSDRFFARWRGGDDEPLSVDKRYLRSDGSTVWVHLTTSVVRDAAGEPAYAVSIVEDVTQRRLAEMALAESESRFRAVFERADLGIVVCGLDGEIIEVNPALQRILGRDLATLRREGVRGMAHPDDLNLDHELFADLLAGRRDAYRVEKRFLRPDGSVMLGLVTVTLARTAETGELCVALIEDITARREAEREIAAKVAELEAADRYKDEFLAIVSHELRTPLNFILGFGSILEDGVHGELNSSQMADVARIMAGAERMSVLVGELLDFARIQAGKLVIDRLPTPIRTLVEEVCCNQQPAAEAAHIALDCDVAGDPVANVDPLRIHQVLDNMVGNAIKFTRAGGRVTIAVRERPDALLVEVIDTGIGIAPENLDAVFSHFTQANMSSTREAGGFGLGLAIAKALVEAHDGEIGVRSEPGVGSIFWFTLPRS